jgi:hypothetical protein
MTDELTVEYMLGELQAGGPEDGNFYIATILEKISGMEKALRILGVSPNEELIRIIKEFKIRCDAGTDPKDLSIVMNMLPDSLKRGKALTEKKPEELCGHSGPGNSCSATDAFDSNNKCVFEDKTKCSERAKTIGGRRWVNGDIAAALREIERLEKIEAQVQTCKRSGHRYYAASHEYPCPRCEIESLTREAEDRGLEAADAKATLKSADNKIAELNLALEKKTAIAQEYWDKFRNYEDRREEGQLRGQILPASPG